VMVEGQRKISLQERISGRLAEFYPGKDLISVFREVPMHRLAKQLGIRTKTLSSLIPPEEMAAKRKAAFKKGLAGINDTRKNIAQDQAKKAEKAIREGVSEEEVRERFSIRKSKIQQFRVEHVGSRQGKNRTLNNPTIREYLQRRDVLDRLLTWEGSELDRIIIAQRLLQGDAAERATHKQIGKDNHYSESLVRLREKEILEKIGAFEARDEATRRIEERRAKARERRRIKKQEDEEMTA
ncbi:MAG TPA: hypothetical protein VF189_02710, partial [Patescibacteria group bacterium]